MKFRHIVIICLLLGNSIGLLSQKNMPAAFIITHSSDTVHGTGIMERDQKSCRFRTSEASSVKTYLPADITAFRYTDGSYFVSHEVPDGNQGAIWYFLEILVDGEVDLYALGRSGMFYVKKEGSEFLELNDHVRRQQYLDEAQKYVVKDNSYLGYLRIYMADAPQLFTDIDRMDKLNQRDLVKLSVDYHHAVCSDYECTTYTKDLPPGTLYFNGWPMTLKLEGYAGINLHNPVYTPAGGILLHIGLNRPKQHLLLKTGLIYSVRPYFYSRNLEYNLKIPISLYYKFGNMAFKPYLGFGFPTGNFMISSLQSGFIYSLSDKLEFCLSASIDAPLYLLADEHMTVFGNNFGHSVNAGLIWVLQ